VLPPPLYRAATHVFAQDITGCMLVGGTALAGYYAGHRRSDDLDLFVLDDDAHRATVLAVSSLRRLGCRIGEILSSAQYFKASCNLERHDFTVDVVLDPTVHALGSPLLAKDGVQVASLEILLSQKAATLVSRCSEKDLYDLRWLFQQDPGLDLGDLLALGARIDGGLTAEGALISLAGTEPRLAACGFSLSQADREVLDEVKALKRSLEKGLEQIARGQPAPAIGKLVRTLKK
jgi:hypothetical protein